MAGSNTTHLSPVFGRLFWMMVGPMALVMTTYFIVSSDNGWATGADFLFFAVLGGMIFGRWLEFRGGDPQTQAGEPATAVDLRRYIVTVVTVGPIVWAVANVLGNYVLNR